MEEDVNLRLNTEGTPKNPYETNTNFLTIEKKQSKDFFNKLIAEADHIQDHLAKTEILAGSPLKRLDSPADPNNKRISRLPQNMQISRWHMHTNRGQGAEEVPEDILKETVEKKHTRVKEIARRMTAIYEQSETNQSPSASPMRE